MSKLTMHRTRIIKAIETYSDVTGLKPSTICQYALRNRRFYDNLVTGGDYLSSSAERLMDWIRAHPAKGRGK